MSSCMNQATGGIRQSGLKIASALGANVTMLIRQLPLTLMPLLQPPRCMMTDSNHWCAAALLEPRFVCPSTECAAC